MLKNRWFTESRGFLNFLFYLQVVQSQIAGLYFANLLLLLVSIYFVLHWHDAVLGGLRLVIRFLLFRNIFFAGYNFAFAQFLHIGKGYLFTFR